MSETVFYATENLEFLQLDFLGKISRKKSQVNSNIF